MQTSTEPGEAALPAAQPCALATPKVAALARQLLGYQACSLPSPRRYSSDCSTRAAAFWIDQGRAHEQGRSSEPFQSAGWCCHRCDVWCAASSPAALECVQLCGS
jgi:hypothetical protein